MYLAGIHYAQLTRALGLGLGLQVLDASNFYKIIELLYPYSQEMLSEMCDEAKEEMKNKSQSDIGSYKRAVTTSDGCWLTRGFFSKNFTFHVKDFMSQALLYYVHLCQRGSDSVIADELYPGTSKSCEGYAAELVFQEAAKDGMHIEVNWQDGDSSSENAFHKAFPDKTISTVMLCAGHVGRAHGKQLDKVAGEKQFSQGYKDKHRKSYPEVDKVSCNCHGKKHSKNCGCMSDNFLRSARINHSFAIMEAHETKDPATYKSVLKMVSEFHAKNIHSWDGGKCTFHPQVVCSCGSCDKDNLMCEGKPYNTKYPLTCPMHQLAYKIECDTRAQSAEKIIHKDFGKGHSNLPETNHAIFTKFRAKDLNIQRLHYVVSTNFGLMQANMAWLTSKRGKEYHWIPDLYRRLGIPVTNDIVEACRQAVQSAGQNREDKKGDHCKDLRIKMKQARRMEHEDRKRWGKEQKIKHTYGIDEDEDEEIVHLDLDKESDKKAQELISKDNISESSGTCVISNLKKKNNTTRKEEKSCRCGSTEHKRTSHKDCPLRAKQDTNVDKQLDE